jgi:uncharacterized caspase-like protein
MFSRLLWALAVTVLLLGPAGKPAQAQAARGKKYALLVGVKKYNHARLPDLYFTENDVTELAKLLRPAGYEVTLLTDSQGQKPTAANIKAALAKLMKDRGKGDTVLVALAGHGLQVKVKDRDESFFCPSDARLNDVSRLVSINRLLADFADCGASVKLLLVDASRTGHDARGARPFDVNLVPRPPRGFAALFSCSSGQHSFESEKLGKGHGVFFFHVLEALRGKAKDKDGEVDWASLSRYVTRAVSRQVPVLIGGGAR